MDFVCLLYVACMGSILYTPEVASDISLKALCWGHLIGGDITQSSKPGGQVETSQLEITYKPGVSRIGGGGDSVIL